MPDLPVFGGLCPQCGHSEDHHGYMAPDEICSGTAFCKVGAGDQACHCWREWPKQPVSN